MECHGCILPDVWPCHISFYIYCSKSIQIAMMSASTNVYTLVWFRVKTFLHGSLYLEMISTLLHYWQREISVSMCNILGLDALLLWVSLLQRMVSWCNSNDIYLYVISNVHSLACLVMLICFLALQDIVSILHARINKCYPKYAHSWYA